MIKVRIPTPLRPLTKGQGEVESAAANIVDMIGSLDATYPGLKNRLCDEVLPIESGPRLGPERLAVGVFLQRD